MPAIIDYDYTVELKVYRNVITIDTLIETLNEFLSLFTLHGLEFEVADHIFKKVKTINL